jgi:hypothetical protein
MANYKIKKRERREIPCGCPWNVYHDYSCFPQVNRRIDLPYVAMGVSLTVQVCDFQADKVAVKNSSWFSAFFLLFFSCCCCCFCYGCKVLLASNRQVFSTCIFRWSVTCDYGLLVCQGELMWRCRWCKGTEMKMTVTNTKFGMIKRDDWRGNYSGSRSDDKWVEMRIQKVDTASDQGQWQIEHLK